MRPIGGWLMGLYADYKGRKAALMASVLLMCFGSLIIALTPGYESIGVGAPILLVFARLLQGLSVGVNMAPRLPTSAKWPPRNVAASFPASSTSR